MRSKVPIELSTRSTNNASGGGLGIGIVLGKGRRVGRLRIGGPKVLGRIGSPRPPRFGSGEHVAGTGPASVWRGQCPHEADIGDWERVRVAQGPHGNVLGRPFADTR